MIEKKIPTSFEVQVYGDLTPYSPTISKARVRIFYRGLNRNWSYITDEFANKIIADLPYAPIKGIYDDEGQDFTDHGNGIRSLGKAYGVVPENNNGAWERHIDTDGIERIYYCCDVLLWTTLYENAKKIPGKSQSMELDEKSIKGEWKDYDTFEAYEFTDGHLIGLQALGDNVEPCFEGAAFYNLKEDFSEILKLVKNYNAKEETTMPIDNSAVGTENEATKEQKEFTENTEQTITEQSTNEQTTTEQSTGEASTENGAETGSEAAAEGGTEGGTEGAANTSEASANTEATNYEVLYNDLKVKFDELQKNFDEKSAEFSVLQEQNAHLIAERDTLQEFKASAENKEKEEVIAKYSAVLPSDVIKSYEEKMSEFSAIELDKELCFEAHKNDALEPQTTNFSYKNNETEGLTQLEECLASYKIN